MKKILSILISIMIIISAVSVPASVNAAVKIKNKTLYMYTEGISLDGGNGNHAYKYSVKNKKYIKVDFDGGEVGNAKAVSVFRNKRRPDQLGEGIRYIPVL